MTDVYSPEKRSAVMRRVKSSATKPELAVRRLVWSLGGRYRLNRADLPGKPDIVLPKRRLAIFVHGCFWHGHDCARGARVPKANREYWVGKVGRNRARDEATRAALEASGWRVEVVWECGLNDEEAVRTRLRKVLEAPLSEGEAFHELKAVYERAAADGVEVARWGASPHKKPWPPPTPPRVLDKAV